MRDNKIHNYGEIFLELVHALDRKVSQIFYNNVFLSFINKPSQVNEVVEIDSRAKMIIKAGKQSPFDVNELVKELYAYYAEHNNINNIYFLIDTQLDWVSVRIAKESFYQIIFSLIDIKLHFLSNGDELYINITQQGEKLACSIKDTGFFLTEGLIKKYSNYYFKRSNPLFLNWDELVNLLDVNGHNHQVGHYNKMNYLQIEFVLT